MIVSINSVVGESCLTTIHYVSQKQTPILPADNEGFKPKTEFTTEKSSFSQKIPFSQQNLDSHHTSCFIHPVK